MNAMIRQRVENILALLATMLVLGGLYSWTYRVACIAGAVGIVLLMAALRLKARAERTQVRRTSDVYGVIARIRADRDARFERPAHRRNRRPDRERLGR